MKERTVHSFSRFTRITTSAIPHVDNEKHRIIFSVDRDIRFCGVGLDQKVSSNRIILMILEKNPVDKTKTWNKTVASQNFAPLCPGADRIFLGRPVQLTAGETYMILVSFYGGESYIGVNVLETVNAVIDVNNSVEFRFANFGTETITNVNQGMINRIFFSTN